MIEFLPGKRYNLAMENKRQVEIYKGVEGEIAFNVDINEDTIWATQSQIAELFGVQVPAISRHLKHIFEEGELNEKVVVSKMEITTKHGAMEGKTQTREANFYNLDAIISIGYRVNSRKATDFRIWATKVLKRYLVDGAAVNERRLKELPAKKLQELEGALTVVKRLMMRSELSAEEAKGILEVISKYDSSFQALEEYDEGHIVFAKSVKPRKKLSEEQCLKMISELKKQVNGGELFGRPRDGAFNSSISAIFQTFDGDDVYKSVAEKAANLLYLVIKDHPFYDGNKRIGALLFIIFLTINNYHLTNNGETKISDRALTALALLIAESNPDEKDLLIALICKLLED